MPSAILKVKVDRTQHVKIHRQVAATIREAITSGEVGVGERLPPARDLATILGVNSNTVLKALRLLRDEEVLEFRRGRGVTVIAMPTDARLLEKAEELVAVAQELGIPRQALVDLLDQEYQRSTS